MGLWSRSLLLTRPSWGASCRLPNRLVFHSPPNPPRYTHDHSFLRTPMENSTGSSKNWYTELSSIPAYSSARFLSDKGESQACFPTPLLLSLYVTVI